MSAMTAETVRNYIDLTKPRLLPLVLFSGLPVMGMSAGGWAPLPLICWIFVGICLAAASANTLNAYLEIDTDSLMERTRNRPLPAGRIAPRNALVFGVVLAVLSTVLPRERASPIASGIGSRTNSGTTFQTWYAGYPRGARRTLKDPKGVSSLRRMDSRLKIAL